jgi:hypothetical protein
MHLVLPLHVTQRSVRFVYMDLFLILKVTFSTRCIDEKLKDVKRMGHETRGDASGE